MISKLLFSWILSLHCPVAELAEEVPENENVFALWTSIINQLERKEDLEFLLRRLKAEPRKPISFKEIELNELLKAFSSRIESVRPKLIDLVEKRLDSAVETKVQHEDLVIVKDKLPSGSRVLKLERGKTPVAVIIDDSDVDHPVISILNEISSGRKLSVEVVEWKPSTNNFEFQSRGSKETPANFELASHRASFKDDSGYHFLAFSVLDHFFVQGFLPAKGTDRSAQFRRINTQSSSPSRLQKRIHLGIGLGLAAAYSHQVQSFGLLGSLAIAYSASQLSQKLFWPLAKKIAVGLRIVPDTRYPFRFHSWDKQKRIVRMAFGTPSNAEITLASLNRFRKRILKEAQDYEIDRLWINIVTAGFQIDPSGKLLDKNKNFILQLRKLFVDPDFPKLYFPSENGNYIALWHDYELILLDLRKTHQLNEESDSSESGSSPSANAP